MDTNSLACYNAVNDDISTSVNKSSEERHYDPPDNALFGDAVSVKNDFVRKHLTLVVLVVDTKDDQ